MKALLYTFLFSLLLIISCTQPPDYPDEPVIGFISMSRNTMPQSAFNADSLTLVFSFTDGDGDIGDRDSLNIFLIDKRDGADFLKYRIPFIPEQGTGNGISGEITMAIFSTCCIPPDVAPCSGPSAAMPVDTLVYQIYIKDRAGNESNIMETDPIFLLCQ